MNKILLALFICIASLNANLSTSYKSSKNFKILRELNIDKSFIYDKTLEDLYIKLSSRNQIHHYKLILKRSSSYISKIQEVLIKEGLPKSFLFLSMAESNFKIDVKSKTGALGLWQFMPKTGRLFNLRIDDYVDERLDFIKSTKAASTYLSYHHKRFKKWYLAILAYNCGEGRIIEAITRATIDKYLVLYPNKKNSKVIKEYKKTIKEYMATKKNFYKIYNIYKKTRKWKIPLTATDLIRIQSKIKRQYLPKESRIYLRKIIVLAMIANKKIFQKSNIFIRKMNLSLTSVKVKSGLHLRSLASILNMKFSSLKELNKHITQNILPVDVKYYDVNIPYNKLKLYNKYKTKMKNNSYHVHIVKAGDSLSSLGNKYKIKYSFIKSFNELKSNSLFINQKIVIPLVKKRKNTFITHRVKKGETLSSIAYKYKVRVKDILKINKLKSKNIRINKKLIIPSSKILKTTVNKITYKVKIGDTLDRIALKYNISLKKLKKDNNLTTNTIKIGETIAIFK